MDDLFFKYGIILVGVVIITLLISFAQSALSRTIVTGESKEQQMSAKSIIVKDRLEQLCQTCLNGNVNRDCFVMQMEITDQKVLCQPDFSARVVAPCLPLKGVVKVMSDGGKCVLRVFTSEADRSKCLDCTDAPCCSNIAFQENCFWDSSGTKCMPKDCAQLHMSGCGSLYEDCCRIVSWDCKWETDRCTSI